MQFFCLQFCSRVHFSWVLAWLSCQTALSSLAKKCLQHVDLFSALFWIRRRARFLWWGESQMVSLTKNTCTETPHAVLTDVARLHSLTHIFRRRTFCRLVWWVVHLMSHRVSAAASGKSFTEFVCGIIFKHYIRPYRLYIYLHKASESVSACGWWAFWMLHMCFQIQAKPMAGWQREQEHVAVHFYPSKLIVIARLILPILSFTHIVLVLYCSLWHPVASAWESYSIFHQRYVAIFCRIMLVFEVLRELG